MSSRSRPPAGSGSDRPSTSSTLRAFDVRATGVPRAIGPPHHVLHDPAEVDVGDRGVGHPAPVAENGDAVADLHQLLEAVRDVDDGHAPLHQVADHAEERGDLHRAQRRGGLVHDQDPHVLDEGPGDLDDLLQAQGQPPHERAGIDGLFQPGEGLRDTPLLEPPVHDHAVAGALPRHEDVVGDAQVREEAQLLVDDPDAQGRGVPGRVGARSARRPGAGARGWASRRRPGSA